MLTTIERERVVNVVNIRRTNKEGGSSVGHDEEGKQRNYTHNSYERTISFAIGQANLPLR
jgi:hypothetical protein